MAKLELNPVTGGYLSTVLINRNNDAVEAAIENTLSRDGSYPNNMSGNLDMDSNRILNLPDAQLAQEPVTYQQLLDAGTYGVAASGNVSYTRTGTNTATRTVTSKLQEVVTPQDYGIIEDGTTDGLSKWEDLVTDSLAGDVGFRIVVPPGTYLCSDWFPFRNTVSTELRDFKNTTLDCMEGVTFITDFGTDGCDVFQLNCVKNFHIKGFPTLKGTAHSHDLAGSNGVSITGGFDNVTLEIRAEDLPTRDVFLFTITSGTPVVGNVYTQGGTTYECSSFDSGIMRAFVTGGTTTVATASGTLSGTPSLNYSEYTETGDGGAAFTIQPQGTSLALLEAEVLPQGYVKATVRAKGCRIGAEGQVSIGLTPYHESRIDIDVDAEDCFYASIMGSAAESDYTTPRWIGTETWEFTINSGTPVGGNSYTHNGSTYLCSTFAAPTMTATRTAGTTDPTATGTLTGVPNCTFTSQYVHGTVTVPKGQSSGYTWRVNSRNCQHPGYFWRAHGTTAKGTVKNTKSLSDIRLAPTGLRWKLGDDVVEGVILEYGRDSNFDFRGDLKNATNWINIANAASGNDVIGAMTQNCDIYISLAGTCTDTPIKATENTPTYTLYKSRLTIVDNASATIVIPTTASWKDWYAPAAKNTIEVIGNFDKSIITGPVQFPSTRRTSSDPNCIDWYNEYALAATPVLMDTSLTAGGEGQTVTAPTYLSSTLFGDVVLWNLVISMTGLGTLTVGDQAFILLGSLPNPYSGSSAVYWPAVVGFAGNLNLTAGSVVCARVKAETNVVELYKWTAAGTVGPSPLLISEVTASGILQLSGWYKIAT